MPEKGRFQTISEKDSTTDCVNSKLLSIKCVGLRKIIENTIKLKKLILPTAEKPDAVSVFAARIVKYLFLEIIKTVCQ